MEIRNREQDTHKIKLSIQVSLDGLCFCALDPTGPKVVFFKDIRFPKKLNPIEALQQIERIYEQEKFLQQAEPEVRILYSNDLYSLVPEKLFNEEEASDYLKFNTKILETDFVAQDYLDDSGIVNIYIPYTNINNYFFDRYGEFEYRHTVTVLAQAFLERDQEQQQGAKVYLNQNSFGYDLLVIRDGNLIYGNSFQCTTKEDFIYYLLFTAEQLDLDPREFELVLLGNIDSESEFYKIAYTYIRKISFLDTAFGYYFQTKEEPPKGYRYYSLFKTLQ